MPAVDPCINTGDTTWMLLSSVLVLGMMPALAFFEAGMLRSKNTLSVITQVFTGLMVNSVMWFVVGYSLVFAPSVGQVIGNPATYFLMRQVGFFDCNATYAPNIPHALFAIFMMMFAAITPLLITGATAEKMAFKPYVVFVVLWELLVYYPIAHAVWGKGILDRWGVLDFAGGIVIHTTAGAGSLVAALFLGPRAEFEHYHGEFPQSNLPLAMVGTALLWMGWNGFNGGSALEAGPVAVSAVFSTHLSACVCSLAWTVLGWWHTGKPSIVLAMNGALAGLAGITPASGYVDIGPTMFIAAALALVSYYGVRLAKTRLHIDDSLDVSIVHGLTGAVGSLSIGIFASTDLNAGAPNGLYYSGGPLLLAKQAVGVLVALVWAAAWTWVILAVLSRTMRGGVRVSEAEEAVGLDWHDHGDVAYHDLEVLESQALLKQPSVRDFNLPDSAQYRRRRRLGDV